MKLTSLFTVCCFEVLLSMIGVWAQPRYRMMVDPPIQVINPPPDTAFVVLCFREQGSVSTEPGYCPLGIGGYIPNGPDQRIDTLDNIDTGVSIPPAYPTATILGVGLLVNFQDSGTNSLALHIFTQIGGEAPGTLFTIPSTQINGTDIVFTITIGAICLEEDTGVDCNSPPVTGTTEITTATSTTQDPMPMTTELEAPTTGKLTTMTAVTKELTTAGGVSMTSSTSPTTTEGSAGNADAQSIVPIAAGVGGGVAALFLLLLLITALIVVVIAVTLRKNKRELSEEYKGEIPMTNNPVYGTTHKTTTETTEEIDTSRNPVYGIHDSKTNTGQDSQEYEDVWLH